MTICRFEWACGMQEHSHISHGVLHCLPMVNFWLSIYINSYPQRWTSPISPLLWCGTNASRLIFWSLHMPNGRTPPKTYEGYTSRAMPNITLDPCFPRSPRFRKFRMLTQRHLCCIPHMGCWLAPHRTFSMADFFARKDVSCGMDDSLLETDQTGTITMPFGRCLVRSCAGEPQT